MEQIRTAACIGSGTIGSSWALNFAWKGVDVRVYDIGGPQLEQARRLVDANLDVLVENGVLTRAETAGITRRITYTTALAEAVGSAGFIQECGPEDYGAKRGIMAEIEASAPAEAVIASSTSGLLITEIGRHMAHPERLVGGHPYNPPHLLPLVEIVKGERSAPWAVQTAYDFYLQLGKEPVVVQKEVSGFIANRVQVAVFREMIDLVQRGVCSLEDADKAMLYGPGLRWGLLGPMAVLHLGGGPGGIRDNMLKQRESYDLRLSDMADWKHFPQDLAELAEAGMAEELVHRPAKDGRTVEEMSAWRDKKLIQLLRLHHKL